LIVVFACIFVVFIYRYTILCFRVTRFRITNYLATETDDAPTVPGIISTPSSRHGRITASVPYQSTAKLTRVCCLNYIPLLILIYLQIIIQSNIVVYTIDIYTQLTICL